MSCHEGREFSPRVPSRFRRSRGNATTHGEEVVEVEEVLEQPLSRSAQDPGWSCLSFLCSTTEACHSAAGYSAREAVPSVWRRPATRRFCCYPQAEVRALPGRVKRPEANLLQYLLHLQNLLPQRSCFHAHERRKMLIRPPFPYAVPGIGSFRTGTR